MTPRTVSIIIPTHNRRDAVIRTLRALATQTYPPAATEIIVVADGCSDDTPGVAASASPTPIRLLEQPASGPAAARNRGAGCARGDILIFLDDDIEVAPGFVAAHVEAQLTDSTVVVGYLPPDVQRRRDFFAMMLRAWWEAMFDRMRDPGHRFAYTDLLSGNFSVSAALFRRTGGFDEAFRCHEDYELGYRMIAAGARFAFASAATGWHQEHTDLVRALQRKRDEGRADVALARKHPALAHTLPVARLQTGLTRRGRALRRLAMFNGAAGDVAAAVCRRFMRPLEAARRRTRWRRLLNDLLSYWYWRGVVESLGAQRVEELIRAPASAGLYELDLMQGFGRAAAELDAVRPAGVALHWGPLVIATVPARPGAELLQGRHLGSLLRGPIASRFAMTLAVAHESDTRSTASEKRS
jgi:glycosyltransferase involved in cell wall biosynthesis